MTNLNPLVLQFVLNDQSTIGIRWNIKLILNYHYICLNCIGEFSRDLIIIVCCCKYDFVSSDAGLWQSSSCILTLKSVVYKYLWFLCQLQRSTTFMVHFKSEVSFSLLIFSTFIQYQKGTIHLCWKTYENILQYGLEIANRTAWLCVSAHLSAARSKNQEPFGSRNWMRLWSDSGKNKQKQECLWTGTLHFHFQLKVLWLLR